MGQGVPQKRQRGYDKITFHNRYGITLAADRYLPKTREGRLPAIAVSVVMLSATVRLITT